MDPSVVISSSSPLETLPVVNPGQIVDTQPAKHGEQLTVDSMQITSLVQTPRSRILSDNTDDPPRNKFRKTYATPQRE